MVSALSVPSQALAQRAKIDATYQVIGAGPKVQVRDQLMDSLTFYLRADDQGGAVRLCGAYTGIEFLLTQKDMSGVLFSINGQTIASGTFLPHVVTRHHPTAVAMRSPLGRRSPDGRRAKCVQTSTPWVAAFKTQPIRVSVPDKAFASCKNRNNCILTVN